METKRKGSFCKDREERKNGEERSTNFSSAAEILFRKSVGIVAGRDHLQWNVRISGYPGTAHDLPAKCELLRRSQLWLIATSSPQKCHKTGIPLLNGGAKEIFRKDRALRSKEEIVDLIEQSTIGGKAALNDSLLPSIRLIACACDISNVPIGASRLGGAPDLPAGFDWPAWEPLGVATKETLKSEGARHLDFIAQINLEEASGFLCSNRLPSRGMLYFFYDVDYSARGFDPKDAGSAKVIYYDGPISKLQRAKPDHQFVVDLTPAVLVFTEDWTVNDRLEMAKENTDAYQGLIDAIYDDPPFHRLFGRPQVVKDEMELECQLVSNGIYCGNPEGYASAEAQALKAGAGDWRLLLQVDSDQDNLGFSWGDLGRLYFWIREQDLEERKFEKAWLILQSH